MKEFKSVQDLIIKAALYDKVSTTISADELLGRGDVIKITFEKNNRYINTYVDLVDERRDPEEYALCYCKRALYKLLETPYEETTYPKENNDD
jgi:hypothetical protein